MSESMSKRVIQGNKKYTQIIRNIVGDNIYTLRNERGLTQKELATLMGLKKQQISDYERGINLPSLYIVIVLAKALGCRITDIYMPDDIEEIVEELDLEEIKKTSKS